MKTLLHSLAKQASLPYIYQSNASLVARLFRTQYLLEPWNDFTPLTFITALNLPVSTPTFGHT